MSPVLSDRPLLGAADPDAASGPTGAGVRSDERPAILGLVAVVARVLPVLVRDSRLAEMVAEQPVTPVQVVVVVPVGVEQDARKLAQVVETVVDVDDRVEAEPAVPHLLDQLAARPGHR